jgi:hypothetical protein
VEVLPDAGWLLAERERGDLGRAVLAGSRMICPSGAITGMNRGQGKGACCCCNAKEDVSSGELLRVVFCPVRMLSTVLI